MASSPTDAVATIVTSRHRRLGNRLANRTFYACLRFNSMGKGAVLKVNSQPACNEGDRARSSYGYPVSILFRRAGEVMYPAEIRMPGRFNQDMAREVGTRLSSLQLRRQYQIYFLRKSSTVVDWHSKHTCLIANHEAFAN